MAFTVEEDTFIVMAYFRSGIRDELGAWTYSTESCYEQFVTTYGEQHIPFHIFAQHQERVISRFMDSGSVCKGKSPGRPKITTPEVVANVQEHMLRSPQKSIRQLSQQVGVSYSSCRRVLKEELHMHPYKVSVVQELHPRDFIARVQYCQWFLEHLNDNAVLDKTFFTDEGWFHLNGYINSQNYRTWATENPHVTVETSLHPIKIGVWVAISRARIVGPIFFNTTINAERYRTIILDNFLNQLDDVELTTGYFQQDGATAHTSRETLLYLEQFFHGRLISRGLWPPRSPDLTSCDSFLFAHLKNKIYRNRLHTLEELQEAILGEIQHLNNNVEILRNVSNNMKRRVHLCIEHDGQHFEQFM